MRTVTHLFGILFLALAAMACQQDPAEEPTTVGDITITTAGGMIRSPKWLADKVEEVADLYSLTPSGEKHYPWVLLVKYEGQEYIWVMDGVTQTVVGSHLFFTLSGEPIEGLSDLWKELYETAGLGLIDKDDCYLLWRYEYGPRSGHAVSTRANTEISFYPSPPA